MKICFRIWLLMPVTLILQAGCASGGPRLNEMAADSLFLYGMERLEERDWSKAVSAFETFGRTYASHPRAAEGRFRMGQAYMGQRDYVTAAIEFNRLAADFPAGAWADDARFNACRSYYELAPPPPLDQEYTRTAIEHCRTLIAGYPDSDFVPQARELVVTLVNRLAHKEFDAAEHYYRRNALDSSIIYYTMVVDSYPESEWAPRALARIHEAYVRLGYTTEAEETRARLLRDYPQSAEARQLSGGVPGS